MPSSVHTQEYVVFLQLLREVRTSAGVTQADLASRLRRPQAYISKYESGERRLDVIELREICRALDVELTDVVAQLERVLR